MRTSISILVVAGVLCGVSASPGYAQQEDNPLYKHWAQFEPGSYAVVKMITDAAGNKTEMTTTQTLKECTPEKAVIEVKTVMMMSGQKIEQPPTDMEIAAKIPKQDVKGEAPEKDPNTEVKEGTEEIEIAGKKIKAKWTETKSKQGEMVTTMKVWTSEDVPGQTVKMTSTTTGPIEMKTESELVKFEAKKR